MKKKGQSGMNAAVLIAVLAALIIIYIIFLPSEDRLDIIGENESNGESFSGNGEKIIMEEEDLIMEFIGEDEIIHDIPSINLYTRTASDVIKQENSVYVKNGLFDKQDKTIEFKVEEPDNIDDVMISFYTKKSKGRLIVTLNSHEIYNGEIEKVNADPIKMGTDFLAENNVLNLEVSGVGAKFWATNEYLMENFKITGDVTDISTQESVARFIVPRSESSNIEKSTLRFIPECQPTDVGILEILLNNHVIFSSVPDCGIPRPLDFSPVNIITGENKLAFRTEKGRYLIDQIKVTTELLEQPSYTFFFDLEDDEFDDIEDENKKLNLSFQFTDDRDDKEAEIIVNNRKTYMTRHDDFEWSININQYVEEGSNSLKIIPEERMEIRKLMLILEDD